MNKKIFTTAIGKFNSNLWGLHIMVPMDISAYYLSRQIKRFNCSIDNFEAFSCAMMSAGEGKYFVMLNKEKIKKWHLQVSQTVSVEMWEDESKYGMPMPEEMAELMKIDKEGSRLFHDLTPGKQRSLIHLVGKSKKSETRLRKAWIVIEYLKSTGGKIEYQSFNEALRANRDIGF